MATERESAQTQNPDDIIGCIEAAAIVGLNRNYFYKLAVVDKRIPGIRVGRNYRYRRGDVVAFAETFVKLGTPREPFDADEPTISAAQAIVKRTRQQQGLPPRVSDEAAIRRIASVFTYSRTDKP